MNQYQQEYTTALALYTAAPAKIENHLAANQTYQQAKQKAYDENSSEEEIKQAMSTVLKIEKEVGKLYDMGSIEKRLLEAKKNMLGTYVNHAKNLPECDDIVKECDTPEKLIKIILCNKQKTQTLIDIAMRNISW